MRTNAVSGKLKTKAISNRNFLPHACLEWGRGGGGMVTVLGNKRHCQHCGIWYYMLSTLRCLPSLPTSPPAQHFRTACCLARNQGGLSHLCCLPPFARRAEATTWNLLLSFGFYAPFTRESYINS